MEIIKKHDQNDTKDQSCERRWKWSKNDQNGRRVQSVKMIKMT